MSTLSTDLLEFELSDVLWNHNKTTRSIDVIPEYLLTGSYDYKVHLYKYQNGKYLFDKQLEHHSSYVHAVKFRCDGMGFFTGSRDKTIMHCDILGNPTFLYEGHESDVNCLSQSKNDVNHFFSGSWDATARLWDVETGKCILTLGSEHHAHAVTVLALDNGNFITGSQNSMINYWDKSGNKIKSWKAHEDIIRGLEIYDQGFASCSNDSVIKIWDFSGNELFNCIGHSGFVFSIATFFNYGMPSIVSGGDDRTVKVWSMNEMKQSIGQTDTIWSVKVNIENDILCACTDGAVRVFTKNQIRLAEEEVRTAFKSDVESKFQQALQGGSDVLDLKTLPSIQDLGCYKGNKEGDIRVFRNGDRGEAYMWHIQGSYWEKIGDVVGGPEGGGNTAVGMGKQYYPGDQFWAPGEYDRVFDVEIQQGVTLKLPFNYGDNALISAEKFVVREGLKKEYVQEIQKWINDQTNFRQAQQQSLQQHSNNQQQQQQPIQSQQIAQQLSNAFNQAQSSQQQQFSQKKSFNFESLKWFPQRELLCFENINFEAAEKKILELNIKPQQLDELELGFLKRAIKILKDKPNWSKWGKDPFASNEVNLIKKLLQWPKDRIFPAFDLIKNFLLHEQSQELFRGIDEGMALISKVIESWSINQVPNYLTGLKLLANSFKHDQGMRGMLTHSQFVLSNVNTKFVSPQKNTNKSIKQAVTYLLFNYSVAFQNQNSTHSEAINLVNICLTFMRDENEAENLQKCVLAIGNSAFKKNDIKQYLLNNGIIEMLTSMSVSGNEQLEQSRDELLFILS